ncbi:MAG: sensor histidine kinase [Lysobacteraceae bacterium]
MARQTLSLQARQFWAAGFALVAFLGLTGLALDRAFSETALSALRERLQTFAHAYLAGSDLSRGGQLIVPDVPPEPRFLQPGAGLYAGVHGNEFAWRSPSAMGRDLPFDVALPPGETRFDGPLDTPDGPIYRLALGVAWEMGSQQEVRFTFLIAEQASALAREVTVFRRTLWGYLGAAAVVLLAVQILVLRWSLQPVRKVISELSEVEHGVTDRLHGVYPRELAMLTNNINDFIESERDHLKRHRKTLGDLAHSLKTPLAVLRARIESDPDNAGLRDDVRAQVARMDQIVAYQLSRAATMGHQVFAAPIEIAPHAEELVRGLEKVYAKKNVLCEFDLDSSARFYGELGDLMELLGNLLENAFKWADHRVLLSTRTMTIVSQRRSGLLISVDDDGPGIPADQVERLLQRGVRGDERVQGHGIGLDIVQDIVRAYRGELSVERSDELGGARFVLRFSPAV